MQPLLTYDQAAAILNVAVGTLYAKVSRKQIPHRRLSGRLVRFDEAELKAWIAAHAVKDESAVQPNDC